MKTKDIISYSIILLLALVVLFQTQCNEPDIILNDNTDLFNQISVLSSQSDSLELVAGNLTVQLEVAKNKKDSIVYKVKTKYITVHDTISNTDIECLPKPYVDTLISTYENLIKDSDVLISVKSEQIINLEIQNEAKDTIIDNFEKNEAVYKDKIKRERVKKWKFGGVGVVIGYVLGKIF